MRAAQILPVVMIVLSAGASVVYAMGGDWRKGLYWAAAALIAVSVTF